MKTISNYFGVILLAGIVVGLSSCEQSSQVTLSESFDYITTVTPIQGAQHTTMNLQAEASPNSFFDVTLENGSVREGWCIEWNDDYVKGEQQGVKFYSTKGHTAWELLNYFMSIKDQLMTEDPSLTYREVQVIIWSLIENPSFNVDQINEYENLPSSIYSNGQAHFDVQKVKNIVADVRDYKNSAQRKKSPRLLGVTLIENDGQTIMMGDETAFAVKTVDKSGQKTTDANYSTCFADEIMPNVSFKRWGWTSGPISEGRGERTYDLYAGAGTCDLGKGTLVGTLAASYSSGKLRVTYSMTEESFLPISSTHCWKHTFTLEKLPILS